MPTKRLRVLFSTVSWMVAFASLVLITGCSQHPPLTPQVDPDPSGELSRILDKGILVVATDADYPPQSYLDPQAARAENTRCDPTQYTPNQLEGFDVDVAVEIARRLGVEVCFVTPTWSQVVSGNWGGLWDINAGSMAVTAERMQKLYFTQPYISGEAVMFVHRENFVYQNPSDLSGKQIGVCTGCAYEAYLKGSLDIPGTKVTYAIRNPRVIGYDTDTSALDDLALGDGVRLDAVITDPDTGRTAMESGLPIKQLGGPLYHDYSAVTVDKNTVGNPLPLVEKISAIIQEMHRDGTLLNLSQKYYGGDFTTPAADFDLESLGQISQETR